MYNKKLRNILERSVASVMVRITSVIVTRIQAEGVGQGEDLIENGFVESFGIPLVEVRPAAASDEEGVPRESHRFLVADVRHATCSIKSLVQHFSSSWNP